MDDAGGTFREGESQCMTALATEGFTSSSVSLPRKLQRRFSLSPRPRLGTQVTSSCFSLMRFAPSCSAGARPGKVGPTEQLNMSCLWHFIECSV